MKSKSEQFAEKQVEALGEFNEATRELHAAEVKAQELVLTAKERYAKALQAMHQLAISSGVQEK